METLLFALLLVFLKIRYECARWRGAETRLVSLMHRCSAGCPFLCVAPWFGLGSTTLFTALWVQLYHRRRTSLARVNISLGLFLEVQKGKIHLEISELTQNQEEIKKKLWKNH